MAGKHRREENPIPNSTGGCLAGLAMLPLTILVVLAQIMLAAKHRGWDVSGAGAKPVCYPSKARAKNVARQVKGGKVTRAGGKGCPLTALTMLALPAMLAAAGLWLL